MSGLKPKAHSDGEPWVIDRIDVEHWRRHREGLESEGFANAYPGKAGEIDRPIAQAAICSRCKTSMRYIPMTRVRNTDRVEQTYYAFAVCLDCDIAVSL